MSNSNSYEKKAQRRQLLGGFDSVGKQTELPTKGDIKQSLFETGKDILVGAIGGGVLGALIGRPSLGVGILVSGIGYYTGSRSTTALGLGMMASGGYQVGEKAVSGTEKTGMEGVKERLTAFKEDFKRKLYLDKVLKSKTTGTSGLGDVRYFVYPGDGSPKVLPEASLSALEHIENQIAESAEQYVQATGIAENVAALDPTDRNY